MNDDVSSLCEVRAPTFRRPALLRRALLSLTGQTHTNWRCIVFDDCPNGSAQAIVDEINDRRIVYARNRVQLGAIGNIDQAFAKTPLFNGRYAFVLEDDNYLLPSHIQTAIRLIEDNRTKVVFCNQICEIIDADGSPSTAGAGHTLDWMYAAGAQSPEDLLPALLYSHGFSNGAVFWRSDCQSDFQVGDLTTHPGVQESVRLLRLKDASYVSLEATAVWHPTESEGQLSMRTLSIPRLRRAIRNRLRQLRMEKQKVDFHSAVLKRIGERRVLAFVADNRIADFARHKASRLATIERSMLLCGYNARLTGRGVLRRIGLLTLGLIVRHCTTPLKIEA
jgi:Glycosyl transferase family 2